MAEYFFGITDKGKRREKNEDTFIAQKVFNNEFIVACVIDGVGGYSGGEVAAEIARSVIVERLQNLSGNIIEVLQNAIVAANAKIHNEKSSEKNARMACVLTCAVTHIKNNKFYYAHVGDTRLYLLRENSLVKISRDHSVVGFLEESGRLSEEDAMRHPRRNEINKALGFEEQINSKGDYIETGESPFLPGDTILLCSDGLSDMISSNTIISILNKNRSLAGRAQELVDAANEAGGNDNITAVLVENNKQPRQLSRSKPVERKNVAIGVQPPVIKAPSQHSAVAAKKGNNKMIKLLAFLSFGLLVALCVSFFQNKKAFSKDNRDQEIKTLKAKDEKLIQLISWVNDTSKKMYAMSAGDSLTQTSDPILINKDSFHLRGNGSHIICDTNYKGPAFIISNTAKHIVLDSLVFENFDVALIVQKNNIIFRNVRFINCRVAVQYAVSLPDSTISGRFKDSIFITTQSLKKR